LVIPEQAEVSPQPGDIVLKPFIDGKTYKQHFRVETWNTHDLLDGPFDDIRTAMNAAFELSATSRLAVWLDYSDHPDVHELDNVPLYYSDPLSSQSEIA
jgi:hypothetical protein